VGTFEHDTSSPPAEAGRTVALPTPKLWAPPPAEFSLPAVFPDTFEVRVLCTDSGPKLVAAIELISPGNKDRADKRWAFAVKCTSYLCQGISLIIVDIVTNRRANLHNELMHLMNQQGEHEFADEVLLYAVAYQPLRRAGKEQIDVWRAHLAVGKPLPCLALGLRADLTVPVDFEATYAETSRR
jgi:hypothetical protein